MVQVFERASQTERIVGHSTSRRGETGDDLKYLHGCLRILGRQQCVLNPRDIVKSVGLRSKLLKRVGIPSGSLKRPDGLLNVWRFKA